MSGLHRMSRRAFREPSALSLRWCAANFGLIAMVLLATLAIVATVMFPDVAPPAWSIPG
jgi:hypothetical protein